MVGDEELRERNLGNNKWWTNLCDHSASIKSERNISDYSNVFNSYNSGNVYDVYDYGYVTWHRSNLTWSWFRKPIDSNDGGNDEL